jgi:hypothetical protein
MSAWILNKLEDEHPAEDNSGRQHALWRHGCDTGKKSKSIFGD